MPRFKERQMQMLDLVDRFEAKPSSVHVRNALGAIERLKEEGFYFWDKNSDQLSRWQKGCTTMWEFLNTLGQRRLEGLELAEVMREFFQEFEHSTGRMRQILCSDFGDSHDNPDLDRIDNWFCLIYRLSTYALVSFWLDDKTEELSLKVNLNLVTGETQEKWTRRKMQIPKKYQHAAKWPKNLT